MRRALRLAGIALISVSIGAILSATAWCIPARRRGRYRTEFQRAWSRAICAMAGIRVEVVGKLPEHGNWLGVSNHIGYIDILALGSVFPAAFVSKSEVSRWPLIGRLAKIGGTEFVHRGKRSSAAGFTERIASRIASGGNILLFPEGTSTDGREILPFKSAPFAAVAGKSDRWVLPIHVDVVEIDWQAAVGRRRDAVCWYGEASFLPHLLRLLKLRRIRYRVVVGSPIPGMDHDRKTLARISREQVASLGRVSARRRSLLPWNFLWIHSSLS